MKITSVKDWLVLTVSIVIFVLTYLGGLEVFAPVKKKPIYIIEPTVPMTPEEKEIIEVEKDVKQFIQEMEDWAKTGKIPPSW